MKLRLLKAAFAAATTFIFTVASANPVPLTYVLDNASATAAGVEGFTINLTGTFTLDFSLPDPLTTVDIIVIQPPFADLIMNAPNTAVYDTQGDLVVLAMNFPFFESIGIKFLTNNAPDFLIISQVGLQNFEALGAVSDSVTGEATLTPLPAALPLFAAGLGVIGLLGWRRKRKAAALAA